MGLVKQSEVSTDTVSEQFRRPSANDAAYLLPPSEAMKSQDLVVRRDAVKRLRFDAEGADLLLALLKEEHCQLMVEAIFDSLLYVCQASAEPIKFIDEIVALLPEMEAEKRNSTIIFLSAFPNEMSLHMRDLLSSPNSDLQLYALDILRGMQHPQTPVWLREMLNKDLHINVLLSVLERVGEYQSAEMYEEVKGLYHQYSDEPIVSFAINLTLNRLGDSCENV